jgi:hypothetical protein
VFVAIFPHYLLFLNYGQLLLLFFYGYCKLLHLCWTHVLCCGFSCTNVLMNYEHPVGQEKEDNMNIVVGRWGLQQVKNVLTK